MTFRVDYDALTWAGARAWFGGSSLNAVVHRFVEEYAAVPPRWMARLPPPWTPENRIRPVMDPIGAGHEAAGRMESWAPSEVVDSALAEVLWVEADRNETLRRQG